MSAESDSCCLQADFMEKLQGALQTSYVLVESSVGAEKQSTGLHTCIESCVGRCTRPQACDQNLLLSDSQNLHVIWDSCCPPSFSFSLHFKTIQVGVCVMLTFIPRTLSMLFPHHTMPFLTPSPSLANSPWIFRTQLRYHGLLETCLSLLKLNRVLLLSVPQHFSHSPTHPSG